MKKNEVIKYTDYLNYSTQTVAFTPVKSVSSLNS